MRRTVFTAGYSGRSLEELVSLLREAGVERVVDVRSFPNSRREEFDRENLEMTLPDRGMEYLHLPELGGYRDEGYRQYVETEEFHEALELFENLASEEITAALCLESEPSDCHRRFIARELRGREWRAVHLVDGDGGQTTL